MNLYDLDGCSQSELCKEMKPIRPRRSQPEDLGRKGYVCRRQKDGDRRFKFIYLTPKARGIQGELEGLLETWITYLVEGFEEAKRDEMFAMMHAVAERASNVSMSDVKNEGEMKR